jgi:ubiquinone/menaquinone biosynthesis C-methylase UbiE
MNKLFIAFFLFSNIFYNKVLAQKLNPDSISKDKLQKTLAFLNLTEKDIIADIGTGTGYSLVPIAGANPKIIFTVEDIDSTKLTYKTLTKQIEKNGSKANIQQFKIVYGTETSTNLPSATFNKILVFDVIHELSSKKEMLDEIKRILQQNGSVFIEEILVRKPQKKDRICNYPFLTEEVFLKLMEENNFILKREEKTIDNGKNKYIKIFEYSVDK